MPNEDMDAGLEKARAFFARAEEVAATDNFDYAIDMYLEGLYKSPDALEDGHAPLRRMALIRQGKGGKRPSIAEKVKRRGGKTPLEEMLNAEYLLAKDPDHLPYAEAMLTASVAGGYTRTAEWIAQLVFEANRARNKPSFATYLLLKDSYAELQMYPKAIAACQFALEIKPAAPELQDELRNLSAQMTVLKGRYGQDGDFRQSIRDRKNQERLQTNQKLVKTADFRTEAVKNARKAVASSPAAANIIRLADALVDLETTPAQEEALRMLEQSYEIEQDFALKRKEGELRIKICKNDVRTVNTELVKEPANKDLKQKWDSAVDKLNKAGLEHYRLCVAHYPTDLQIKYEYGVYLLNDKQYDKAIPMFQEAQMQPQYKLRAMDKMGVCFLLKGWYTDAIDIFSKAIKACEAEDSNTAKELKYNLARSYEHHSRTEDALRIYHELAQLDFGYRDISSRIDKLRNANSK